MAPTSSPRATFFIIAVTATPVVSPLSSTHAFSSVGALAKARYDSCANAQSGAYAESNASADAPASARSDARDKKLAQHLCQRGTVANA